MSKILRKILRLGAFVSLVVLVFFTSIVQKLGLTSNNPKDEGKNANDLFASFTDIQQAHADAPPPGDGAGPYDVGPACDSGPCGDPCPH